MPTSANAGTFRLMNTQCPHCRTVFRIGQEQLAAAGGRVRCGHCREVFNARQRLQKELQFGPVRERGSGSAGQGRLPLGQGTGMVSGLLLSDIGEADSERPRHSYRGIAAWAAVNLLLVTALLGQVVYAQREAFATDDTLRPVVLWMCNLTGCTLPPRRAVDRIELVRRSVYAHPNAEGALIIDATFVNSAAFAQPLPILTVSLGDRHGDPLIRRSFQPAEYRPELDQNQRMAPGAPVRITLEVRDPGPRVRTFELGFS